MNPDETLLANVPRHFFGLVVIYVEVLIGLVAAGALLYFLLPTFSSGAPNAGVGAYVWVGMFLVTILALLLLVVATQIYTQNRLIITSKNVTQIAQKGLFHRTVSELSMANVEDVTAAQTGIFAHMFGYGELRIETAGEQNNFHFVYCPDPNYYGKMVLDARQQFLHMPEATAHHTAHTPHPPVPPAQPPATPQA